MANQTEKQALGLPSDASEEQVLKKIEKLSSQAEEAKALKSQVEAAGPSEEDKATISELEQQIDGLTKSNDELTNLNESLQGQLDRANAQVESLQSGGQSQAPGRLSAEQADVGEGKVRTENGVENLVEKRVKVLSATWETYQPNPLKKDEYVLREHRATRGDVVKVPESVAERFSQPDIDAFFDSVDPEGEPAGTPGGQSFAQMSEADLINWHRTNNPSTQEVINASEGDADTARRLISAETAATGGDPREEVVHGLGEIIGRANS